MAKRYRKFKRVSMEVTTAKKLEDLLVDLTLHDHYGQLPCDCSFNAVGAYPHCVDCKGTGELPKCPDKTDCVHVECGSLSVARLIQSGLHIGKKRAHLDIPDEPEVVKTLVGRLRAFEERAGRSGRAFIRIANAAAAWASRGPLERLAEAGLELD